MEVQRELAYQILKAKLYQLEEDRQKAEAERAYGEKGDVGWGNQIRSYVFQPYQKVLDLRTGEETNNIQATMDGVPPVNLAMVWNDQVSTPVLSTEEK